MNFNNCLDKFDVINKLNNTLLKGKLLNNGIKVLFIFNNSNEINEFLSIYNMYGNIEFNLDILYIENSDFIIENEDRFYYDFVLNFRSSNFDKFCFVGVKNYGKAKINFITEKAFDNSLRIEQFKTEISKIYNKYKFDKKMTHVTSKLKSISPIKDKILMPDKFLAKTRINTSFDIECYSSANFGRDEIFNDSIVVPYDINFNDNLNIAIFLRRINKALSKYGFTYNVEIALNSSDEVDSKNRYYKSLVSVIKKTYPKSRIINVGLCTKNTLDYTNELGKTYIDYYHGLEKDVEKYYNNLIKELNRRSLCIVKSVEER